MRMRVETIYEFDAEDSRTLCVTRHEGCVSLHWRGAEGEDGFALRLRVEHLPQIRDLLAELQFLDHDPLRKPDYEVTPGDLTLDLDENEAQEEDERYSPDNPSDYGDR